jgi:hypothetical protein
MEKITAWYLVKKKWPELLGAFLGWFLNLAITWGGFFVILRYIQSHPPK